jgi:hypothetical protein
MEARVFAALDARALPLQARQEFRLFLGRRDGHADEAGERHEDGLGGFRCAFHAVSISQAGSAEIAEKGCPSHEEGV